MAAKECNGQFPSSLDVHPENDNFFLERKKRKKRTALFGMYVDVVGVLGSVLRRVQVQIGRVIEFGILTFGIGLQSEFDRHVEFL